MKQLTPVKILVVAALLLVGLSSVAHAARKKSGPNVSDYSSSGFGMDISVYGLLNFSYHSVGFGAGAQFAYPLFPNGFIKSPRFRDAFHIEGGFDFGHWSWNVGSVDYSVSLLVPSVGVRYAVYVLEKLAPYVCLKLGPGFLVYKNDVHNDVHFYWGTTVGLLWDFNDIISLRAEFGYGYFHEIIRIGVLFRL